MTVHTQIEMKEAVQRGLAGVIFDETAITDIGGRRGRLSHRGYPIEQLAADPSFERVVFLLLHGEWPTQAQHDAFRVDVAKRRGLPEATLRLVEHLAGRSIDDVLRTVISSLDLGQHYDRAPMQVGLDVIAKIPSVIAAWQAARTGTAYPEPDPALDHGADLLRRVLGRAVTGEERRIMNLDLVLHADHGANASTFTARVVTSTGADVVAAMTAAIAAFAGPLHGGAVTAAGDMLAGIETPAEAKALVKERRSRNLPVYGFGHRVYRHRDPRSVFLRAAAESLATDAAKMNRVAVFDALVEAMAPFKRMGIDVNVDFYGVLVYRLLGIPNELGAALYTAGRSAGWLAQILEQRQNNILIRPRLRYAGPGLRDLSRC